MLTGGCQCGAVRYEIDADVPVDLYACHCRECQKQSASAFGISAIFRRGDVRVVKGETRVWSRPTDSGHITDCHFCQACGTRIIHDGSNDPDHVAIKGGSLDEPPDMSTAKHIWTNRAILASAIPASVEHWPGEPPE